MLKKMFGSVRFQVIIFTLLVVLAGNITLNYFLTQNAVEMLINEKQEKLENTGHYLLNLYEQYFVGDQCIIRIEAREHLKKYTGDTPKTEEDMFQEMMKYKFSSTLTGIIETSIDLFGEEGGAGFYIKEENRVYGFYEEPSMFPYQKLIVRIPVGESGSYIWVEESYKNIDAKIASLQQKTNDITLIIVFILLLFSLFFGFSFSNRIKKVLFGLKDLEQDLYKPMPIIDGELGEISRGIDQLAQSLILSRTRSDLILNNASTGMISIDKNNQVLFFNDAATNLLNIKEGLISMEQIRTILGPIIENVINRTFKIGHSFSFDNYPVKLPNMQKYFHIVVSSHLDPTKEKIILITLDDVTENVKLIREAEKNESLRMLGMFTTGIAHEIRNPLTSVKGFVQLLGKKVVNVDGAPRMVHLVTREIDRLESLLKDLITYARPSKTNFEWMQVSDLISIIEKLLTEKIKQRKLVWYVKNVEKLEICADSRKVHQVLFNLVLNAIQSVKIDKGEVTVYGIEENDYFWICIKDNGYGIASEDFGKIFTPFFTTKDKGTGLGLAISRRMMEDMNGKIVFESSRTKGTTFKIGFEKWRKTEIQSNNI
ncbi:MAG: hypothetical protein KAH01_06540 [Caldisericia bacterium]|nr:hypothetical protein [Caldisericia bacterium]